MDEQSEHWQQEDSEKAFLRCLELVQMAERGEKFKTEDIADLIYFLGVNR